MDIDSRKYKLCNLYASTTLPTNEPWKDMGGSRGTAKLAKKVVVLIPYLVNVVLYTVEIFIALKRLCNNYFTLHRSNLDVKKDRSM